MAVIPDDQMFALPGAPPPKQDEFFDLPPGAAEGTMPSQERTKPATPNSKASAMSMGRKRDREFEQEMLRDSRRRRSRCMILLGIGATLTTLSLVLMIIVLLHSWTDMNLIPGMMTE